MAWKLPDGKTISTPKGVVIDDVQYSADIFYRWSKQELAAIGIKPFREERYDSKWYKSTGSEETEVNGEIVKSHTVTEKLTEEDAKVIQVDVVKAQYISGKRRATEQEDFYDAVGDNVTKKVWSDYIKALKNDANTLKDAVNAAGTYDEIKDFKFEWTSAPDAIVIEEEEVVDG